MNIAQIVRDVQRALGVAVDGNPGPMTWAAIHARIVGRVEPKDTYQPPASDAVDERSEKNIATLHERVRPYARALVNLAKGQGINIKVISGTRTFEEQDALYQQGRSKPGRIITNAKAGSSWHNHGVAFDVGVFQDGKYTPESPLYKVVASIGKGIGLEWGGDWKSITDEPHYQMTNGKSLAEAMDLHEQGKTVFS